MLLSLLEGLSCVPWDSALLAALRGFSNSFGADSSAQIAAVVRAESSVDILALQ